MEKKTYNQIYYQQHQEREKERGRIYRQLNNEKIKKRRKEWYQQYGKEYRKKNIEKIRKTSREWARRNPKPYFWNEVRKEAQRRYRAKHKKKIAEKRKIVWNKRKATDIQFRLRWLLRGRIISAIKKNCGMKAYKTMELIGCSIKYVKKYIEEQFTPEMSWENHGKVWEIDHIIPCKHFDLTKPEEQKKCFHYTNLQPLIKWDNRSKGSKIPQDNDIVRPYKKL